MSECTGIDCMHPDCVARRNRNQFDNDEVRSQFEAAMQRIADGERPHPVRDLENGFRKTMNEMLAGVDPNDPSVAIPYRNRWDRARRKKENKAARKARRVNR